MKIKLQIDSASELASFNTIKGLLDNTLDDIKAIIGGKKSFRFGFNISLPSGNFLSVTETDGASSYINGGLFHVNAQGQIVDKNDKVLQPGISIPQDAIEINIDANGLAIANPNSIPQTLGILTISQFTNPAELQDKGNSYFGVSAASGDALILSSNQNIQFSLDDITDVTYPIIIDKDIIL